MVPFIGAVYHTIRFLRGRRHDQVPATAWRHLSVAVLYCGVLILLKPLFILVLFAVGLFAGLAGPIKTDTEN